MPTFLEQQIINLTKRLYPRGRAWKIPIDSVFYSLHKALSVSESQAYDDMLSILDSILPDNPNFTEEDATNWERRLAITSGAGTLLEDRKSAILQKMRHPGDIKARQHFLYVEGQLKLAGFDVFVYENRFPDGGGGFETKTIEEFVSLGSSGFLAIYGAIDYGEVDYGQLGVTDTTLIANYIDVTLDETFDVGANLRSTFFIGGPSIGDFADLDINRQNEFRNLILKLKPAQTVGYLLINYI